ncbi:MAG: VOC family protein [Pseudomonadota bacterium]
MSVTQITPYLPAADPGALAAFYREVFGRRADAGMRRIACLAGPAPGPQRLQIAPEGGSGTDLPAVSLKADELAATLDRARATGAQIVYGPVDEPWGARRFCLRDPAGNTVNVATHT